MGSDLINVISDLHIGAGPLDDCDDELENCLIEFFNELSQRDSSIELVINGDFLDFAQAPPWKGSQLRSKSKNGIPLCFTEEQSISKLEAIYEKHKNIFKSLNNFLNAKSDNRVTILPGNHDADFFWPGVRELFFDKVCGQSKDFRDRLNFHLNQVYCPPDFPTVWIEHGHQYDPGNCFYIDGKPIWSEESPPIFEDLEGKPRLYECVGTRFLIKFLNDLDNKYPFVDNVKPFSRFIKIFGMSAFVPGYGPLKAAVAVWEILTYFTSTVTNNRSDLLGLDEGDVDDPNPSISKLFNGMDETTRRDLTKKLKEYGFPIDRPLAMYIRDTDKIALLMDFLSKNPSILDEFDTEYSSYLGSSENDGTLTLVKGFSLDETKALITGAKGVLKQQQDLNAIIMGHTHESIQNRPDINLYINTGSWTRYYCFEDNEKLKPWSMLRTHSYKNFPYQLNFAEITQGNPLKVKMGTFREKNK